MTAKRLPPGCERHICGCVSDAREWRELCADHGAEVASNHAAHAANMDARRARDNPGQAVAVDSGAIAADNNPAQ
jgi:hypothetical protein